MMSSHESSGDKGVMTPDRIKPPPPTDSDEEPTDLVINIKEEPMDDEYYEDYLHNNGETSDDQSEDLQQHTGEGLDESESDYYKEINIPQVAGTQVSETPHTRVVVSPCISAPVPNGGAIRPFKFVRSVSMDQPRVTPPPNLTSRRLVPIKIKTSGPIPIALTLSKPRVGPKTKSSALNSQATAHHLMTLATEADKILKKQEKRLKSETESGSDHTDEGKHTSNSEEENMSSDSSGGGMDAFLNSGDQTLTLIQRRAAEASLSNTKKTKRKRSQLPDDMKDDTYWERRRKNNEAAKRSRDARRAKEDQIAIRAALLEQENMRLKIEVAALKEETVRLKGMLYEKR